MQGFTNSEFSDYLWLYYPYLYVQTVENPYFMLFISIILFLSWPRSVKIIQQFHFW